MPESLVEKLLGKLKSDIKPRGREIVCRDSGRRHWEFGLPFEMHLTHNDFTPKGWRTDYTFVGWKWSLTIRIIKVDAQQGVVRQVNKRGFTGIAFANSPARTIVRQIFDGDADRFDEDVMTARFKL